MTNSKAQLTLKYKGVSYSFLYDFECVTEEESARFNFEEGNNSCDCNRSRMLKQAGFDIPELDCGDNIKMTKFVFKAGKVTV